MKRIQSIWNIKDGKAQIVNKAKFLDAIAMLPDGSYWNTLEKCYKKRSVPQNNSVFGIAYKILQEKFSDHYGTFIKLDFVHEFCKNPDNGLMPVEYVEKCMEEWKEDESNWLDNLVTGERTMIPFIPTTTKMRTVDMMEYYENIRDFAQEYFGDETGELVVPEPDPNWKDYEGKD